MNDEIMRRIVARNEAVRAAFRAVQKPSICPSCRCPFYETDGSIGGMCWSCGKEAQRITSLSREASHDAETSAPRGDDLAADRVRVGRSLKWSTEERQGE